MSEDETYEEMEEETHGSPETEEEKEDEDVESEPVGKSNPVFKAM